MFNKCFLQFTFKNETSIVILLIQSEFKPILYTCCSEFAKNHFRPILPCTLTITHLIQCLYTCKRFLVSICTQMSIPYTLKWTNPRLNLKKYKNAAHFHNEYLHGFTEFQFNNG